MEIMNTPELDLVTLTDGDYDAGLKIGNAPLRR